MCMHMPQNSCDCQMTTFRGHFSPATSYGLEIKLKLGLVTNTFTHGIISSAQILTFGHKGDPAHLPKGGVFSVFAG